MIQIYHRAFGSLQMQNPNCRAQCHRVRCATTCDTSTSLTSRNIVFGNKTTLQSFKICNPSGLWATRYIVTMRARQVPQKRNKSPATRITPAGKQNNGYCMQSCHPHVRWETPSSTCLLACLRHGAAYVSQPSNSKNRKHAAFLPFPLQRVVVATYCRYSRSQVLGLACFRRMDERSRASKRNHGSFITCCCVAWNMRTGYVHVGLIDVREKRNPNPNNTHTGVSRS
jgi:hypothetical protein